MPELVSMRRAYGRALAELGQANPRVVVLDADVSASTQSYMFREKCPERFFNVGVAEATMLNVAVGLALGGKIPFANTFAFLMSLRAAEQIRTCIAYPKVNVKLIAGYGGLSDSFDGPTHHAVCDLAVVRSIPGLTVMVAADAMEAKRAVRVIAEYDGPVYLRLSRAEVPVIYGEDYKVTIGKGNVLRKGGDITLVGTGIMVHPCLQAAEELSREGIEARVLALSTLKPMDEALIVQAAEETGALVTAEEHTVIGGLGSAVAETLTGLCPAPLEIVGIADTFAESGPYPDLLARYGLTVEHIVEAAHRALRRKASDPGAH